ASVRLSGEKATAPIQALGPLSVIGSTSGAVCAIAKSMENRVEWMVTCLSGLGLVTAWSLTYHLFHGENHQILGAGRRRLYQQHRARSGSHASAGSGWAEGFLRQDGAAGWFIPAGRRFRLPRYVRQRLQRSGADGVCRHSPQDLRLEAAARRQD